MKQFSIKVFVAISFLGIALFLVVPTLSYGAEKDVGCWGGDAGFWKSIGCTIGNGVDAISGIFGSKKEMPAPIESTLVQGEERLINWNVERIIADVEVKTREFQSVKEEYQEAKTVEERNETLTTLVTVTESRMESMKVLMEKDPQEFLLNAITQNDRAQFPLEVQKNIEREVSFTGDVQTIHYDDFENKKSHEEYFIKTGNERLKFFPVGLESAIPSQTRVQTKGFRLDDRVAVLVNDKNFNVISTASLDTLGPQKVLVLLVNFLDSGAPPFTREEAKKFIFEGQAQNFFKDQSYGKTYFVGDVFGWYTYKKVSTNRLWTSDPEFIDIIQENKIDLKTYDYILFVGHGNVGGGWSTVGKSESSIGSTSYKTAITFVGAGSGASGFLAPSGWGKQPFSWTSLDYLLGHELGHALGVLHASSLECSGGFIMNGPECQHIEYGNFFDVMGTNSYSLSFNALFKEILGWLGDASIKTISTSGRYELRPIENSNGIRGAKVKIQGSDKVAFYLEYRRGIGFDERLNEAEITSNQSGLFINKYNKFSEQLAFPQLLDMTPVPMGSWSEVTLNQGMEVFRDQISGITVGPIISATQEKVVFDVSIGEPKCAQSYPTIVGPVFKNVVSGKNFDLYFNVTNGDLERCPISNFTTNLSLPEGCNVEKIVYNDNGTMVPGPVIPAQGGEQRWVGVESVCSSDVSEGSYVSTFFVKNTQSVEKVAKKETQLFIMNPLSVKISADSPTSKKIEKGTTKFSLLKFDVENGSKFGQTISVFDVGLSSGGASLDILKDGQMLVEGVIFPKGMMNTIVNIPLLYIGGGQTTRFEIRASIDLDNEEEKIRAGINNIFGDYPLISDTPLYGNWMYFNNINADPKITITQPSSEIHLNRGEGFKFAWKAKNFLSPNDPIFLDIMSGKEGKEGEFVSGYGQAWIGYNGDYSIDTSWFPPDDTYRIRVREPNSGAEALSEKITVKTLPLATPTYFSAGYSYTGGVGVVRNEVNLHWFDVSSKESGFEIWRSIDNKDFVPLSSIGPNVTWVVDSFSSSTMWTTLQYKIRAYQIETICDSPWIKRFKYLKLLPKRVLPCEEVKIYSDFSSLSSPDDAMGSVIPGNSNTVGVGEIKIPLRDLVEIRIQDKDNSFSIKGLTKDEIIFSVPFGVQKTKLDVLFSRNEKVYKDTWKIVE